MDDLTPNDFEAALERMVETYEACGIPRKAIISELEAKVAELREEREDDRTLFSDADLVAFAPLP